MHRTRVAIALFAISVAIPAVAGAHSRSATAAGTACVDLGNDGRCDANDPSLAPLLADGDFNASVAEPAWTPRSTPVGVVFDGDTLERGVEASIETTGNVVFDGNVSSARGGGGGLDVTAAGDITVNADAQLKVGNELRLHATHAVHVMIGAFVYVPGNDVLGLDVKAGDVRLGSNVRLSAGGMYSAVNVDAGSLELGDNVQFATAPRGTLEVTSRSDITATNLHVHAGEIEMSSLWSTAGQHRVITLTDSSVVNTYTNSFIDMYAGPQDHGAHATGEAIHLVHSNVHSHAADHTTFDPQPS